MKNTFFNRIKEFLLFYIFSFLCRFAVKQKKKEIPGSERIKKVLIIRFGGIGYALSLTPFINHLKEKLNCSVFLLVDKRGSFVFRNNANIENLVIYTEGFKNIFEIFNQIKYEKFDAIINTHNEYSPLIEFFMMFSDIPLKYGFTHKYHRSYTASINYDLSLNDNPALNFVRLGFLFGIEKNEKKCFSYTPVQSNMIKTKQFVVNKFPQNKFLAGINVSTGIESNSWSINSYKEIITFLKAYDVNILIISTTRDLDKALEISENKITVFYTPSFDEYAAMIAQLNFLFSPECSTILLTTVFDIPVAGIYKNNDGFEPSWKPFHENSLIIEKSVENINHISPTDIIEEIKPFLNSLINNYEKD